MRVLFIYTTIGATSPRLLYREIPFHIAYLSSFLRQQGHDIHLLVLGSLSRRFSASLDHAISHLQPELICFTAVYTQYAFVKEVAAYVKTRYPQLFTLIGGPHASLCPAEVVQGPFDALCIGEGERPLQDLLEKMHAAELPRGIPNLWLKHEGRVERTPTRPFLEDLDRLPFPDREMWSPYLFDPEDPVEATVLISRGCPFTCTNCCNHALRQLASGSYVRFRSPENILAEIQHLLQTHPTIQEIYLETETAAANPRWFLDLCAGLSQLQETLPHPVTYGANFRISRGIDYDRLFSACRRANFRFIAVGLETGSETLRREILRRNYTNEQLLEAIAMARRYGLKVRVYNMIGLPEETPETIAETIDLNRRCQPDTNGLALFFPYPGTDLHRLCQQRGLIPATSAPALERIWPSIDLPGLSRAQLLRAYIWFDYLAYRQPIGKSLAIATYRWLMSQRSFPRLWCEAYERFPRMQRFLSRRFSV